MDRHAALCGAFPDVAIDAVQGYNLRGALNRHLHAIKVIIKIILTQAYFPLDCRKQSRYSTHVSMDDIHAVNSARLYYPSKPVRDPAYRRFIRQLPCAACGKSRYVDAATPARMDSAKRLQT